MKIKNKEIILASKSPRRKALLELAKLNFTVKASSVDESQINAVSAIELVKKLALAKAKNVFTENKLVIGADTIVVINKKIDDLGRIVGDSTVLEKPENKEHARAMLEAYSANSHIVITAFCLLSDEHEVLKAVSTEVNFKELSPEEIEFYINLDEPYDKAGGYGIQGYAQVFITSINGSYTNVVGLPIAEVMQEIRNVY